MDSYRAEKQATHSIQLEDEDAEIEPVPTGGGGHTAEPELEPLSQIVANFNQMWGGEFTSTAQVAKAIEGIPEGVAADPAYKNARANSDAQNARVEHDAALQKLITSMVRTHTELYKQFAENPEFKAWLSNNVFWATYLAQQDK